MSKGRRAGGAGAGGVVKGGPEGCYKGVIWWFGGESRESRPGFEAAELSRTKGYRAG